MKKKNLKQYLEETGAAYGIYDKIVSRQSAKPPVKQQLRQLETEFNKLIQRLSIEQGMSVEDAKRLLVHTFLKHVS